MRIALTVLLALTVAFSSHSLPVKDNITHYKVSFENAVHHEAGISVTFPKIKSQILTVQMSRTSPGRYALHEFAKNVYNVSAVNSIGEPLAITRPNPYQWAIANHDGEVTVTYTLFGDRADGTYAQIDRTHAHLNIPATFMWALGHENRAIKVEFQPFSSTWNVATQLQKTQDKYTFTAPNLAYFMDSPIELSAHQVKSWTVRSRGKDYQINLAVHHKGIEEDLVEFARKAKAIVAEQVNVYGELPAFDYGEYTFIACYLPHVSRDGMEHRNSTILTNTQSLDEGNFSQISTLSHEFFHAWNVERIRPKALEPFDFSAANMTTNLWFAEGFTSYYDKLMIRRAQESTVDEYLKIITKTLNQVNQVPGRQFFTPEGASMLATFTDAGTSIDKTNFSNIFFSYYSYGSAMALALDLSIRQQFPGKSLDDFMRKMWTDFGKAEIPYTREDLRSTLGTLLNNDAFAKQFFEQYIYGQVKPDYASLLTHAGLKVISAHPGAAFLGQVKFKFSGEAAIIEKPIKIGSPLYQAGLERTDQIIKVGRRTIGSDSQWTSALEQFKPGESATIEYIQRGEKLSATITFVENPEVKVITLADEELSDSQKAFLLAWLGADKAEENTAKSK
ncbi:M61 family metallopeptidase [Colwellia hornerae]|uniref:M61 family metallopeptidase n=1 Tax=Colwellia hornerae TaxID=89402 RepID=A0A5C6Q3J1_9GAMM|nr:PDZ domain-containing protein [Colwellia hornerae]TWX47416.1 M61 family metallopeptidase [Colwellia hornerae]TWX54696.1 M61 family metallopeptidase [Colwellia hornerae]TWX63409.1 M61 family metallopeptidase [Colwellia hornerae]